MVLLNVCITIISLSYIIYRGTKMDYFRSWTLFEIIFQIFLLISTGFEFRYFHRKVYGWKQQYVFWLQWDLVQASSANLIKGTDNKPVIKNIKSEHELKKQAAEFVRNEEKKFQIKEKINTQMGETLYDKLLEGEEKAMFATNNNSNTQDDYDPLDDSFKHLTDSSQKGSRLFTKKTTNLSRASGRASYLSVGS